MPLQIKKVTISNFRGISLPIQLNFYKGNKPNSVLIMGRNGSGKSSIVDAWEWFLKGGIEHLNREGVTMGDYPHKLCNGENCFMEVEFSDSVIKAAKRSFNAKKVTMPTPGGEYEQFINGNFANHPFFLRYRDLQNFVYKRQKEKYEYLAFYFGLNDFTDFQNNLQTALTRFDQLIERETKQTLDLELKVLQLINPQTQVTENSVLQRINEALELFSLRKIADLKGVKPALGSIKELIDQNQANKEELQWRNVVQTLSDLQNLKFEQPIAEELNSSFAKLKVSEESITKVFLTQLYQQGLQIIPKLNDQNVCPLCDHVYVGNLIEHVQDKHEKLQEVIDLKARLELCQRALLSNCKTLKSNLSTLLNLRDVPDENYLTEVKSKAKSIIQLCNPIITLLDTELLAHQSINIAADTLQTEVSKFTELLNDKLQKIHARIEELKEINLGSKLAEVYNQLKTLVIHYYDFELSSAKKVQLQALRTKYQTIFDELTVYITIRMQQIFNSISSDVVAFFNILEDNHAYLKKPNVVLKTDKNKAIELSIEFSGEIVMPAYKYLSESQVNSFGLAVFLASVKQFNPEFKFIVLDDVINSFDIYKRKRIINLIATYFKGYQFLVTTHDDIFFEELARAFQSWERLKFTNWDYQNGPTYLLARNYIERIEQALTEDAPTIAGQQLGQYLEWILGVLCESWKVKTEHKLSNQYTLSELFDPLKAKIITQLKKGGQVHQLVALIEEFENPIGFRNFCAHYKNAATNYTCDELKPILYKWKEIEALLYCNISKSYVTFRKAGSVESLICACGGLNLKEEKYYSENKPANVVTA